ncbi:MAG: MFS transporter, partial [Chloroflexi bacterium]|nr:MFS transporter [Chloroflexota bacterium]
MKLSVGEVLKARQRVFYGWWIVAIGAVVSVFQGGIFYYGFSVFFLPIKRDLGISSAQTSLVFSAARLEGGVLGPVGGWLFDRFGPRPLVFLGGVISGLGLVLLGRTE